MNVTAPHLAQTASGLDSIVVATGVTKIYELGTAKVEALKAVDLSIGRGEMLAVMGPSGCGKTTLLNCLSGLDGVTSGNVVIEGKNLAAMSDKERTSYRALRMGFVFQVYNLLPVLTAVENVELPLLVSGVPARAARERSLDALERVELRDWAKHRPAELSGGQRQRVTIARALVNTPAIVWADEPTGALDSATADGILDLMQELNQRVGLTLVLVTHDHSVGARCRRVIRMRDGEIVGEGLDESAA
jgi:putative ABC transport system ATP-binding protein